MKHKHTDYTGQTIGDIEILQEFTAPLLSKNPRKKTIRKLRCRCPCGTIWDENKYNITRWIGKKCPSCKKKDLVNQKTSLISKTFGRFKIISWVGYRFASGRNRSIYKARCKCKNVFFIYQSQLNTIKSCGCLRKENIPKGENHASAVLTNKDVSCIRELRTSGLYSNKEIAHIFKVSEETISTVSLNKVYKDVNYVPKPKNNHALIGKKFKYFEVISWDPKNYAYKCFCVCGKSFIADTTQLKRNTVKSCGCKKYVRFSDATKNKIGKKYKKLTCISTTRIEGKINNFLICKCECGKERIIIASKWGSLGTCGDRKCKIDLFKATVSNTREPRLPKKSQERQLPSLLSPELQSRQLEFDLPKLCSRREGDKS